MPGCTVGRRRRGRRASGGPSPSGGRGCHGRGRGGGGRGGGRTVRYKEVICLWRVLGPEVPVKAVVAEVEGYTKRFTLVSSATELTGLQLLELFCAQFRAGGSYSA